MTFARHEDDGGLSCWAAVWAGTAASGGVFGLLLAGLAGAIGGLFFAGFVGIFTVASVASATWAVGLSRFRVVPAALAGGMTGIAAMLFVVSSFPASGRLTPTAVAACMGAVGGAVGALVVERSRRKRPLQENLQAPSHPRARRDTFRNRVLRVSVLIVVAAFWLYAFGALRAARRNALEMPCRHNLKQIALALENYASSHGSFPPARTLDDHGHAIQSWRAHLMPFLGFYSFDEQYSLKEPWNSPKNGRITDFPCPIFVCPCSKDQTRTRITNYVAVVGPETMWPGSESAGPRDVVNPDAILVIEYPDSEIPWGEPRDLTVEECVAMLQLRNARRDAGPHPSGLLYVTVKGEVRSLGPNIRPDAVRQLLRARNVQSASPTKSVP